MDVEENDIIKSDSNSMQTQSNRKKRKSKKAKSPPSTEEKYYDFSDFKCQCEGRLRTSPHVILYL